MTATDQKIPILDLKPEIDAMRAELDAAIAEVLDSGMFILGPQVKELEAKLAAYFGAKHAVTCNSGTDALVIGLRAMGIQRDDEVITTPFTFIASPESASLMGARPVFVDIEPDTFNMDVTKIEAAITPKSKAIMPVHLFGQACNMDAIMAIAAKHDLQVIEDVAQATGGKYKDKMLGSIGRLGAFSFFPTKNLGAFGDGGFMLTDDDAVADDARMIRVHGSKTKYYNEVLGYNSRLDTMQAAILLVKLPHLASFNEKRRAAAARYSEQLAKIDGVTPPAISADAYHVFHQYTIRIAGGKRDAVQKSLGEQGVTTMTYYPVACHQLPIYKDMNVTMPVAESLADEVLSLPMYPSLTEAQVDRVVQLIAEAMA